MTLVVTTLAIVERSTDGGRASYDISMKAAREMAAAGVDIVVLGGVPINLSRGAANAETMVRDLAAELGVKVTSSALAQTRAAKALGCRKVVVAQPYDASENERLAGYAKHFGCEVLGVTALGQRVQPDRPHSAHAALEMGRALKRAAPGCRQHPVPVAALAGDRRDRAARARARRQRDDRAAGDRVARAARAAG